ncbi:hypothetical protein [Methylocaldum szegediense]|uniref:hypothetical protein n=1 Tax=Methylocaldum szegediense TaxID=73780 RepID=UPI0012EC5B2B|nr:hypothetical protein [Methylocaldum szegediense]
MSLPTAKEITQLYLYGVKLTPHNLVDDALIRPDSDQIPDDDLVHEKVDAVEYMAGPGRFALGVAFRVIIYREGVMLCSKPGAFSRRYSVRPSEIPHHADSSS